MQVTLLCPLVDLFLRGVAKLKKLEDEVSYVLVIHLEALIISVMVATRRSASHDHRRNPANFNPLPSKPPSIEQGLMMQTQLLKIIAQRVLNNPHLVPPIDKHGEFMKGHPRHSLIQANH